MALFYQHTINAGTSLGIWKIEETEKFFLDKVPLQREISHPHKRLQHLAGRYLLQYLFPHFPYDLIKIADTRKPFLSNEAYHFSISHCGDFAAAIVSDTNRVGVDIELIKPMIERIRHKFLTEYELRLLAASQIDVQYAGQYTLSNDVRLSFPTLDHLTLAWSAKEAIYKWYGLGGLDFKKHMQLKSTINKGSGNFSESTYLVDKESFLYLNIKSRIFEDLVLSYVVS